MRVPLMPSVRNRWVRASEPLEARRLLSTTYYVSPTGDDNNAGTSPATAWQTLANVSAGTYNPGDEILLQRGGTWREALLLNDLAGTASQPIIIGAYGDPSQPKPLLSGSDLLDDASFTPFSGTTYIDSTTTVPDWVYIDDNATHNADDASGSSNPSTELRYVETTANSFYYNSNTDALYLNPGVPITNQVLTATERDPELELYCCDYVTVENLATAETAQDEGGYGMYVFGGSNDSLIDCDASLAAKHHFVAIDTNNFLGENLVASDTVDDLGFGGASPYNVFNDFNTAINDGGVAAASSSWINDTYVQPDQSSNYPIFISHGDAGYTANILLQNLQSPLGCAGISLQTLDSSETAQIIGGNLSGYGEVDLETDNSSIDGLTLSGTYASISVDGTNDVVQNCLIYNADPNPEVGHDGALIDNGQDNTFRFNTVALGNGWPFLCITNAESNTTVYGNIFDSTNQNAIWLDFDNSNGEMSDDYNVLPTGAAYFARGELGDITWLGQAQWLAMGYDIHSIYADPQFVDPTNDDFELQPTSPAIDLYTQSPDNTVISANADLNGNPRPVGGGYDAGAFEYGSLAPAPLVLVADDSSMAIQLKLIPVASASLSPLLGVWIDSATPGGANPALVVPLDQVSSISVAAGAQTQQLIVDFSGGSFSIPGGVNYAATAAATTKAVLIGSGASDTLAVTSGQVNFDSLALSLSNVNCVDLDVDAGSATLAYEPAAATTAAPALSVNDQASFTVAAAPAGSIAGINVVNLAALNVASAATAVVALPVDAADRTLLELGSLAIAANASVDLQSNDAILHGGDADTVESWLSSGSADGARTGPGLCSTAAANDPLHLHALGYFLNADSLEQPLVSTFDEQPVVATDVLIKYTIVGDADLNGVVNAADYLMIDNGFALNLTGWRNGDFNYDGVVNGDDYSLIDNAFNTQSLAATNGDDASASPFSTATIPYKSIDSRADKTDARSAQPFAQPTEWPSPPPAGPVFATAPLPQSIWDSLDQLIDR